MQPLIDRAKTAVGNISKSSLDEIRTLRVPQAVRAGQRGATRVPPARHVASWSRQAISDVLKAVLLLMGEFDHSWQNMKTFIGEAPRRAWASLLSHAAVPLSPAGKPSVKQEIVNYDAHRITADLRQRVLAHIDECRARSTPAPLPGRLALSVHACLQLRS